LARSGLAIDGVVAIADPHGEPALLVLRVRLPVQQQALHAALVSLAEACFRADQSC
jgi:hypothetical protein